MNRSDRSSNATGAYPLAVLSVVTTVCLIALGGMVTSTGSGAVFPDWPLASGSVWPADMGWDGLLEHSHRALGAAVGLMVLVLTIWVGRSEPRSWLRKLTVAALGLVVVQGIIGGLGVLQGLPFANSVAHGVLAQVTLCTLATVAFAISPAWNVQVAANPGTTRLARKLCVVALALILGQILLGAIARHSDSSSRWAQTALWSHVALAFAVALSILIASAYCGGRFGEVPGMRRNTRWVLAILLTQLVLGFAALAVRVGKDPGNIHYLGRSALITSHVLVGGVLFLLSTLLMLRVFRSLVPTQGVGSS